MGVVNVCCVVFVKVDEEIRRLENAPNWEQEKAQLDFKVSCV